MSDAPEVPEGAAEHVKGGLGHKLGPLPMGVWILAIGGGLVLAYMMRSRSSSSTDTTADPNTWDYGESNGVGQEDTTGTDTSSTNPITTNEEWQSRALSVLVGMLYEPTSVDRALGHYLSGAALTTVERAIVDEAILRVGPPPISPPPPVTQDQPPPTTTPPVLRQTPLPVTVKSPPVIYRR